MKAYLFPGQGSQFVGMGKDLYNNFPLAKQMFDLADEILGFNITNIKRHCNLVIIDLNISVHSF